MSSIHSVNPHMRLAIQLRADLNRKREVRAKMQVAGGLNFIGCAVGLCVAVAAHFGAPLVCDSQSLLCEGIRMSGEAIGGLTAFYNMHKLYTRTMDIIALRFSEIDEKLRIGAALTCLRIKKNAGSVPSQTNVPACG